MNGASSALDSRPGQYYAVNKRQHRSSRCRLADIICSAPVWRLHKIWERPACKVPKEVDRIFFFNPFSVEILRSVIAKIADSVYEVPREVMLMFYYPSDEYIAFLMTNEDLKFVDEIACDDLFSENKQRERIVIFQVLS